MKKNIDSQGQTALLKKEVSSRSLQLFLDAQQILTAIGGRQDIQHRITQSISRIVSGENISLKECNECIEEISHLIEEKAKNILFWKHQEKFLLQKREDIRLQEEKEKQEQQKWFREIYHDIKTPLQNIQGFFDLLPVFFQGILEKFPQEQEILCKNIQNLQKIINSFSPEDRESRTKQKNLLKKILYFVTNIAIVFENKKFISEISSLELFPVFQSSVKKVQGFISQSLSEKQLQHTLFSLQYIMQDMVNMHLISLEKKKIHVHIDIEDTLSSLCMDKVLLERVLDNLLTNAIKFTQNGRIDISFVKQKENLIIQIKDTGIGIPKEHHKYIFDAFYLEKNRTGTDGEGSTGQGMSIVASLVKEMGGTIVLQKSSEGQYSSGTEFLLTLPLVSSEK
jgi:signal transduction histidine kinase